VLNMSYLSTQYHDAEGHWSSMVPYNVVSVQKDYEFWKTELNEELGHMQCDDSQTYLKQLWAIFTLFEGFCFGSIFQ
jgi:hypothetical protein